MTKKGFPDWAKLLAILGVLGVLASVAVLWIPGSAPARPSAKERAASADWWCYKTGTSPDDMRSECKTTSSECKAAVADWAYNFGPCKQVAQPWCYEFRFDGSSLFHCYATEDDCSNQRELSVSTEEIKVVNECWRAAPNPASAGND